MNRTWIVALLLVLAAVPAGASHVESLYRIPPRRASETAGGPSRALAISADGRYTVIASEAVNLVPGMAAAPAGVYLFLHDRVAGETLQISRRAVENPNSTPPRASLSADGRFVAFQSRATDEIEGQIDTNAAPDVFLWDRDTGETELVSRSDADPLRTGDRTSSSPAVSADGRFVAFTSDATDLVEGLSATSSNVFLWNRQTDEIEPVSRSAAAPGRLANGNSLLPSISADGRFVAFLSLASDLVPGQVDRGTARGTVDVFLWDRTTRQTVLVSRSAGNPLATANRASQHALISANGRFVAFESFATDLLPGQRTGGENIFLWDRETGGMSLVSRGPRGNPARGGRDMFLSAVTPSGSHVLFSSDARNLLTNPDLNVEALNVFLWSRATGRITLVSRSTTRGQGGNFHSHGTGLSADGAWIVFESVATDLDVSGEPAREPGLDIYLANSRSGRITLLSAPDPSAVETIDRFSTGALISADGRWIAFTSSAADFGEGVRDLNGETDVVLTTRGGNRTIVTVHAPGLASATPQGSSFATSIDASGRFVVFTSNVDAALLVPGVRELDANRAGFDVFLYDRELRTLTLVTRSGTDSGSTSDGTAFDARISADGRWVTFTSSARDLLPDIISGVGLSNIFLWDRTTGQTILASQAAGSPTAGGNDFSQSPRISADGSVVVFQSHATDLVAGQTDAPGSEDIFAFDRTTGTVSLVSRTAGSETVAANRFSFLPLLSADGRFVAFSSNATGLVAGVTDTNADHDVFLFDRVTGTMTLASRTLAPTPTAGGGQGYALSGDGRFLVFASAASDLVPGQIDTPGTHDHFLFDRIAGTTILVTHTAASPTTAAAAGVSLADISADGRFVAFASLASNHVPGQVDDDTEGVSSDIFVFDRETRALEMVTRAAGTVATSSPGESFLPKISADGRRVAFFSNRLDLIPGLAGSAAGYNLYVHDRPSGTATLVTHVLGDPARASAGDSAALLSSTPGLFLSASGTAVAFSSAAPGLVPRDFNRLPDAFAASVP